MLKWLLIVICCCSMETLAQSSLPTGTAFALGNITAVGIENTWNNNSNPALLASINNHGIQLNQVLPYGLLTLSTSEISASLATGNYGGIAAQYHRNGFGLIEHNKLSFALGLKLNPQFKAGIKLNYHQWNQGEGYVNYQSLVPEVGILAHLNESLVLGSHVKFAASKNNPFQRQLNAVGIGLKFTLNKQTTFISQITSNGTTQQVSLGCHYTILKQVNVMIGMGINPGLYSFGFNFQTNNRCHFLVASQWNTNLGLSPSIGFLYQWP